MSSPPDLTRECARCHAALEPSALVCGNCHALVHAEQLTVLSASAQLHEERDEIEDARRDWLEALNLLPADSSQAEWIRNNLRRLQPPLRSEASSNSPAWARWFGPLAPLVILLAKGKTLLALFKLKFLLTLGSFVAFYWALYGIKFAIGFAALILAHEMGHFIEIKRRGLPAELPVFLPGLGAYVRWTALGTSAETRAYVSLAGPLAGCVATAICALLSLSSTEPFWIGLTSVSAMLNLLNLIPIWVLDGGQAIVALDRTERIVLAAAALVLALYFGQLLFLLVAAGAGYRVFTKDFPPTMNRSVLAYYLILLSLLGLLLDFAPPHAGRS